MPQYQGVWTLEQQAQALTNQQWVTDPNFKNTTLLLQADGTGSGSQNQTFLDGSTNNFFITRNGNTTQGSFSPFSQASGYWGNYFSGSGSGPYIRFGSSAALTFGTGDFTIEFWVYFLAVNDGTVSYIYDLRDGGTGSFFVQEPANTWTYRDGAGNLVTTGLTSTTFAANQWYHVAICRASGVINFYVNGVKVSANPADTSNYATTYLSIMSRSSSDGASNNTNSYTSNFRVVKGTALYTANFTPQTTPLTAVSGTSLLTCQSNRFVDNSASPLTATVDSSLAPSVQAFGPFAPALQWTPDVVGGSGYFDGSGDYLTTPDNANLALGTGAFTVECWFYGANNTDGILSSINSGSGSYGLGFYFASTTSLKVAIQSSSVEAIGYSTTVAKNTWYHVVAVRNASTNYSVYVNGTRIGTTTNSTNISLQTWGVGSTYSNPGSNYNGYIAGVRIVKGSAVYDPTVSTLTVPTTPPTAVSNTQLLLNYTNAGIYDGKMGNNLETVGNAQVATSPVKYGSGSMYFDGTGDWLLIPNNQMLNLNADFTIEFWIYLNSTSGEQSIFHNHNSDNNGIIVSVNGGAAGKIRLGAGNGSSFYVLLDSSTAISTSTWNHVACTRNINTWTIYINGSNAGSTTNASNPTFSTSDSIQIGRFTSGTPNALNAYLDDFRITKACRYFTTFTPPQQALPRQ